MRLLDLFGRAKVKSTFEAAPVTSPVAAPSATKVVVARVVGSGPPPPQDLRRLVFAAAISDDAERLANVFRENADGIVARAADWMKVPDALRPNPDAVRWYIEGIRVFAQYCAERLDRRDLFQGLDELAISNAAVE